MAKTMIKYELGKNTNKIGKNCIGGNNGNVAIPEIVKKGVKGVSVNAVIKEVVERYANVNRGGMAV